ncbi:hypothetical protein, partial [Afifella marina]|uniref:hypothetical protein n=1 Tax=Afifella marina TaxID=1080 RepID=UPI001AECF8B0
TKSSSDPHHHKKQTPPKMTGFVSSLKAAPSERPFRFWHSTNAGGVVRLPCLAAPRGAANAT